MDKQFELLKLEYGRSLTLSYNFLAGLIATFIGWAVLRSTEPELSVTLCYVTYLLMAGYIVFSIREIIFYNRLKKYYRQERFINKILRFFGY